MDSDDSTLKEMILEECKKRTYLDRNFFEIDLEATTSKERAVAKCQLCPNENRIRGNITIESNFKTHLSVINIFIYC